MKYCATLKIQGIPPMNTASHKHWRKVASETTAWRDLAKLHAMEQRPESLLEHATVYAKRVSCSGKPPDADNLLHSFKPLIDGLRGVVLVDDSPEHVTVIASWERAVARGEQHVSLRIEEGRPAICPTCGQAWGCA